MRKKKNRRKNTFPYRHYMANKVNIRHYMASGSFSSLFIALCSSSDVDVYLTSEILGFASCLHSLGKCL